MSVAIDQVLRFPASVLLAVMGAALVLGACASGREQGKLPPQTVAEPGMAATPEAPALAGADLAPRGTVPAEPAADREASGEAPVTKSTSPGGSPDAEADDSTLILIGRGDAEGRDDPKSILRRASREERERRDQSRPAALVLTDENLAEKAAGGRLTLGGTNESSTGDRGQAAAGENPAPAGATVGSQDAPDDLGAVSEEERYWRSRVLDVRRRWRQAFDDIPRLEGEVERLRTAFYAEDDPARRDRQVKPLWDRALDRLRETQDVLRRAPEELEVILAEGVRAGAQPGWLREGMELEPPLPPTGEEERTLDETDPGEPVLAEPPKDPPPSR